MIRTRSSTRTPLAQPAGSVPGLEGADAPLHRCRNCGFEAPRCNYCPNCGQETTLALPSASKFIRETAGRYVALDGRMWRSLHALLFRPGFLTREYLAGRRRRYVRPARLFVALSIALFAMLQLTAGSPVVLDEVEASDAAGAAGNRDDEGARNTLGLSIDRDLNLSFSANEWPRLAPLRNRLDAFNRLSRQEKADRMLAGMLRYAPYAAIGLLPVFALLLKIAYAGRARRYPLRPRQYAAHLVFGAHNHAFLFLVLGIVVLVDWGPLRAALLLWTIVYTFASLRVVYGGRWSGIVARAMLVAVAYSIFFGLAIAGLLLAAVILR